MMLYSYFVDLYQIFSIHFEFDEFILIMMMI